MEGEFQCVKLKDGLYLGSLATAQDYEFLQINKFGYIVNCCAEIPNHFEGHGLKYLKFKLVKERPHRLWEDTLKKLRKLERFIQQAEDNSLCCLIFSASGNNRSLVMLVSYLMSRYRWALSKTLEFIRAKNVFIGLSQHYIGQLESLEQLIAHQDKPPLSTSWRGPFISEEEQLINSTFLNSQEIVYEKGERKNNGKRVVWLDRIQKQRKKENKESRLRQTGSDAYQVEKKKGKGSSKALAHDYVNPHNSLSTKHLKKQQESPLKKSEQFKRRRRQGKSGSTHKMQTVRVEGPQQAQEKIEDSELFDQKQLLQLIKKNLKMKKGNEQEQKENVDEKGVYRLTINNFIQPNINIMNPVQNKSQKAPKVSRRQAKGRVQSQKQGKGNQKRNTESSPRGREKKLEKVVSLQFARRE